MDSSTSLASELVEFERELGAPLVPGELDSWLQNVRQGVGRVAPLLRRRLELEHADVLKQILHQDIELAARVQQMKDASAALLEQFSDFERQIEVVSKAASQGEKLEEKFASHLPAFSQKGIDVITQIRKQEVALETWFGEAFLRDRGVGG